MLNLPMNQDELLRQLATESVKKGEDIRAAVRDLTLKALQGRQMTLSQIRDALRTIAEGVNLGAADLPVNPGALINDAFAGMDDALLKVVEANRVALSKLAGDGQTFEESQLKRALDELERYEDTLLRSVRQAASGATDNIRAQWADVLKTTKLEGTDTGARVAATLEQYGSQMQNAMRESRTAGLKVAHALAKNYATLVSGVLIGLSEALQQEGAKAGGRGRATSSGGSAGRASDSRTASAGSSASTAPRTAGGGGASRGAARGGTAKTAARGAAAKTPAKKVAGKKAAKKKAAKKSTARG